MYTINITMSNGKTRKETASTKGFAIARAKALADKGMETEVRDRNYGLVWF